MMEWWAIIALLVGVALILGIQALVFRLLMALVSGSAQTIERQDQLNKAMQSLSDQLADVEEQSVETQKEIRKASQHLVNLARGVKQTGMGKRWEDGL